jgi:predicted class III extradiol MEMO1 family dioxygenase
MISFNFFKTRHDQIWSFVKAERLQFASWRSQDSVRRKDHGALDEILQFTDVSRPAISHERIHGLGRDCVDSLVHASRVNLYEVPDQLRDVLRALPQGRNIDRKYLQPIVEVFTKRRLLYHRGQITMCGYDNADVHLVSTVAAQPFEFLLLQNSQQFCLKLQWNVAYFIKE